MYRIQNDKIWRESKYGQQLVVFKKIEFGIVKWCVNRINCGRFLKFKFNSQ